MDPEIVDPLLSPSGLPKISSSPGSHPKRFIISLLLVFPILGLYFGLKYYRLVSQQGLDSVTNQKTPPSISSPIYNIQGLNPEFVKNSIAYIQDNKIMLIDSQDPESVHEIYAGKECSFIRTLQWSSDKDKLAYTTDQYELKNGSCELNAGFELDYLDFNLGKNITIVKTGAGTSGAFNSLIWSDDSQEFYYSTFQEIQKYDTQQNILIPILKKDDPYDQKYSSFDYYLNANAFGKGVNTIVKYTLISPLTTTKLVDEKLSNQEYNPGWGETIGNFSLAPNSNYLAYEITKPSFTGLRLKNLKSEKIVNLSTSCDPKNDKNTQNIGRFSSDSSMLLAYEACDNGYKINIFSSSGKLIHKINTEEVQESIDKIYADFSPDSKKLLLILQSFSNISDNHNGSLISNMFEYDIESEKIIPLKTYQSDIKFTPYIFDGSFINTNAAKWSY